MSTTCLAIKYILSKASAITKDDLSDILMAYYKAGKKMNELLKKR